MYIFAGEVGTNPTIIPKIDYGLVKTTDRKPGRSTAQRRIFYFIRYLRYFMVFYVPSLYLYGKKFALYIL
jgi:hypothetical protein